MTASSSRSGIGKHGKRSAHPPDRTNRPMHRAGGDAQGRARVGPLGDEAHRRSAEPDAEVEVAEELPAGGAVISGEGAHAERVDCKACPRASSTSAEIVTGSVEERAMLTRPVASASTAMLRVRVAPARSGTRPDRAAGDHGMPKRGTTSARRCT